MATLESSKYLTTSSGKHYCFADYPSIKLYKKADGSFWENHLLYGDYIKLDDDLIVENGRVKARSRGDDGWINIDEIITERVLEVNFVDIGQGDGCHVVTPDDQHFIIDAGVGDNMDRYLFWRFFLYNKTGPLSFKFKAIISHSDKDHYGGFKHIFNSKKIRFSNIYHNTVVERPNEAHALGEVINNEIRSLVFSDNEMRALLSDDSNFSGSNSTYLKTLKAALLISDDVDFQGLAERDNYLPGFEKTNKVNGKLLEIKVLAPLIKSNATGEYLPYYKDSGKSKNGHSLVLKLTYDKIKILLGGDLNEYAGEDIVKFWDHKSRRELKVDIAKACHHGSNHFYYDTLKRFNALATVISSGDDESYAHPRPDTLGAIGKCGYGDKPLLFSTEIARSNKEIKKSTLIYLANLDLKIDSLKTEINQLRSTSPVNTTLLQKKEKSLTEKQIEYNSHLTKYGMINVRTDGRKGIISQKLERSSGHGKWDIHKIEYSTRKRRFTLVD